MAKHSTPRIHKGDHVRLLRDIERVENANYAKQGDEGVVQDVFFTKEHNEYLDPHYGHLRPSKYSRKYAKVLMLTGEIKTFRLRSLDVCKR